MKEDYMTILYTKNH